MTRAPCTLRLLLAFALAGCASERAEQAAPAATGSAPAASASTPTTPAAGSAGVKRPPPRPAELTRVTIKALGMYCEESCPVKVRYALADLSSIYELGFDLSTESIFVSYDASLGSAKDVTKPMLSAIKQAGFDPWLGKESWPDGAKVQVVSR